MCPGGSPGRVGVWRLCARHGVRFGRVDLSSSCLMLPVLSNKALKGQCILLMRILTGIEVKVCAVFLGVIVQPPSEKFCSIPIHPSHQPLSPNPLFHMFTPRGTMSSFLLGWMGRVSCSASWTFRTEIFRAAIQTEGYANSVGSIFKVLFLITSIKITTTNLLMSQWLTRWLANTKLLLQTRMCLKCN